MTTEVVRISTIGDIASAVPYLLGFVPSESIVVCALAGERRRFGFTMRLDLSTDPATFPEYVSLIQTYMSRAQADEAMVFVFSDDAPETHQPLVEVLRTVLVTPIADAIRVSNGRAYSMLCTGDCCPAEGFAVTVNEHLAAAHAAQGTAVVGSRDAVVEELRRPEVDEAAGYVTTAAPIDPLGLLSSEDAPYLSSTDVAGIIVGLHSVEIRDRFLSEVAQRSDLAPLALGLLGTVLRRCGMADAPAATTYAAVAYLMGDGVRARTALDRAQEDDPDYSLATLLDAALTAGAHPNILREALTR